MAGPIKIGEIIATQGAEAVEAQSPVDALDQASAVQGADLSAVDPLQQAVIEVANRFASGEIQSTEEASAEVVERLVDLRYGHIDPTQRQAMSAALSDILSRDPLFRDTLEQAIGLAMGTDS